MRSSRLRRWHGICWLQQPRSMLTRLVFVLLGVPLVGCGEGDSSSNGNGGASGGAGRGTGGSSAGSSSQGGQSGGGAGGGGGASGASGSGASMNVGGASGTGGAASGGSGAGFGGATAGAAGSDSFPCGDEMCAPNQYCRAGCNGTGGDPGPPHCANLPEACIGNATCACICGPTALFCTPGAATIQCGCG